MLTTRQYFKAAMIEQWLNRGFAPEDCLYEADRLQKQATGLAALGALLGSAGTAAGGAITSGIGAAGRALGSAPAWLLAGALGIPPAIGAAAGYGLAQLPTGEDKSEEDVQASELLDQYQRLTERARFNSIRKARQAAKSHKPRGRALL